MTKIIRIFAPLLVLALLGSCDDGPIYDKRTYEREGASVKLTGSITGTDRWPEDYSVCLATFSQESAYATMAKALPIQTGEPIAEVVMEGIPADAESVELCVINRLRQRVATLALASTDGIRDTVRLDVGTIDVSPVGTIQAALLEKSCTACHGASGGAAAGLFLTAGRFYDATVGQPSKKVAGAQLIEPGSAERSVFSQVINSDISATWRQNHADMLNRERTSTLLTAIDAWINDGAKQ